MDRVNIRNTEQHIAFYVADKRHFDYFRNVWKALTESAVPFKLVVNDIRSSHMHRIDPEYDREMMVLAELAGFPYIGLHEAVKNRQRFRAVVSTFTLKIPVDFGHRTQTQNLMLALARGGIKLGVILRSARLEEAFRRRYDRMTERLKKLPETLLSDTIIHYPKGMDIHSGNFPDPVVNPLVSQYLVHGAYDHDLVRPHTGVPITMIGYPRYDNLTDPGIREGDALRKEFGIPSGKPIISWIPTYVNRRGNPDFNIDCWLDAVRVLGDQYAIIIRPHPKRIEQQSDALVERLQSQGLHVDTRAERDMTELYAASEFILCDYGGIVFSSIYTDRNLILLNHADHEQEEGWKADQLVYSIRDQLLSLNVSGLQTDPDLLRNTIRNRELWEAQRAVRADIRKRFFGGIPAGKGSGVVVRELKSLHEN